MTDDGWQMLDDIRWVTGDRWLITLLLIEKRDNQIISSIRWHWPLNISCVIHHLSSSICHISSVTCHPSSVIHHMSSLICHLSSIICHLSSVTCDLSSIICHLSYIIGHPSSIICHLSYIRHIISRISYLQTNSWLFAILCLIWLLSKAAAAAPT